MSGSPENRAHAERRSTQNVQLWTSDCNGFVDVAPTNCATASLASLIMSGVGPTSSRSELIADKRDCRTPGLQKKGNSKSRTACPVSGRYGNWAQWRQLVQTWTCLKQRRRTGTLLTHTTPNRFSNICDRCTRPPRVGVQNALDERLTKFG